MPAAPAVPVVVEAPAFAEREAQLGAANREIDRLSAELEKTRREVRQATLLRDREGQATRRLRAKIVRSPQTVAAPASFSVTLPFEYRGSSGLCRLRSGFEVSVPEHLVRKLELVHGDIVCLTLMPPGKVRLEVISQMPRDTPPALVREVATESASRPRLWQALPVSGLGSFCDGEAAGRVRPLGWIADEEAVRLGLRDGDPIRVIVPRAGEAEGDVPMTAPWPGLPALPTVKVLRKLEGAETIGKTEPKARQGKTRRPKPASVRRGHLGIPVLAYRPMAGKTVLIVGGDTFWVNYRQVVHGLGGKVEFISAGGGDVAQDQARARAADVTVLITAYIGHKVKGVVLEALASVGRTPLYVNSRGQKALLEALLNRGRTEGDRSPGAAAANGGTCRATS